MSQLPTSHSRSGGHQGLETFLAPSADKQTGEGDIYGATGVLRESPKCSNFGYILAAVKAGRLNIKTKMLDFEAPVLHWLARG